MSRLQQLIYYSAQNANILPITSVCNVRCMFCSHRQNPPDLEVFRIPPLAPDEVEEILEYMDSSKKIVIGESVTRIIEGEPFTHPQFPEILKKIRSKFSTTPIQITTNGTLLNEKNVAELATYSPLEINLSLNSCSEQSRKLLMGGTGSDIAVNCVKFLTEYQIPYHGSIVAMPHITGWEDLQETIVYLDNNGATTIRVFMPGYTKLAEKNVKFNPGLWLELQKYIIGLREKLSAPLIFEPRQLYDLDAEVEGLVTNSPAQQAGLKMGDLIERVNSEEGFSRVGTFEQIMKNENPVLHINRKGKQFEVGLAKRKGSSSGIVMSYDICGDFPEQILTIIKRYKPKNILFMTSVLALDIMKAALGKTTLPIDSDIIGVPSIYFGGTIMAAGLLVVNDYIDALESYIERMGRPGLIILPAISFDDWGRDLTGESYQNIADKYDIRVIIN